MLREQQYVIQNINSFKLSHTFDCGQCFRRNKENDGSYTGIFGNNIINIQENTDTIFFKGIVDGDIKYIVNKYFDLDRDYDKIKTNLSKVDKYMKKSIQYGYGIRLLNQNLWETIISFIISANNNIPRIKGIIERLSKKFGTEIVWNKHSYYTFPTVEQLKDVSISDYRNLGLGFRDERVYTTTRMIIDGKINLNTLYQKDTEAAKNQLLSLSGIGPKVADCILLFSDLKRLEVFPIDVRVRRIMNQLYIHNSDETKVNKDQIQKIAHEKFGNYAGLAQEYLFYRVRTQ